MTKQRTEGTRKKDCHLTLNILVFTIIISIRFYIIIYEFCMYQNQMQIYLCSEFCVVISVTISSSCLSEGLCLICFLCQFARSGLNYIMRCVVVLFFFVLCTLCCQFLWIVNLLLPIRYSLTFIWLRNRGFYVLLWPKEMTIRPTVAQL